MVWKGEYKKISAKVIETIFFVLVWVLRRNGKGFIYGKHYREIGINYYG